ncbi:hypothetical protein [Acetobacter pasteurianus]|uniref:hypothetical protein n=1 Tax=Acetobacter pasteurianus TaxID=438 RepID=UPI00249346F4|nr:hypothetical protein [Acetobacter pasteurianus]
MDTGSKNRDTIIFPACAGFYRSKNHNVTIFVNFPRVFGAVSVFRVHIPVNFFAKQKKRQSLRERTNKKIPHFFAEILNKKTKERSEKNCEMKKNLSVFLLLNARKVFQQKIFPDRERAQSGSGVARRRRLCRLRFFSLRLYQHITRRKITACKALIFCGF